MIRFMDSLLREIRCGLAAVDKQLQTMGIAEPTSADIESDGDVDTGGHDDTVDEPASEEATRSLHAMDLQLEQVLAQHYPNGVWRAGADGSPVFESFADDVGRCPCATTVVPRVACRQRVRRMWCPP